MDRFIEPKISYGVIQENKENNRNISTFFVNQKKNNGIKIPLN